MLATVLAFVLAASVDQVVTGAVGGGTVVGLAIVLVRQVTNRGQDYDQQIKGWRDLLADSRKETEDARHEIAQLRTENGELRTEMTALRSENAKLRDEVADLGRQMERLSKQMRETKEAIERHDEGPTP